MTVAPHTGPDRRTAATVTGVLLLTVAVTVAAIAVVQWVAARTGSAWAPGGDLAVYRDAATAVLGGGSPYEVSRDGYGFVYPPFAVLTLLPLATVGHSVGYWAWTALSALVVPAVVWLLAGHLAPGDGRRRLLLFAAGTLAVLPLSPIAGTLLLGNVNILLLALVLVDLLRIRGRHQGILIGVAAGLKLTPLIFVAYLLLTGRIRAAVTALATFAATVVVGFVLLPSASATFWGGAFVDGSRTRPPDEEAYGSSLRGATLNLLPESWHPVWLPVSVLAGVAGLAVAVWASRRHEELTGILACAVTGLLVSPVTWYAHWVWCVPLLALLAARPGRQVPAVLAARSGRQVPAVFAARSGRQVPVLLAARPGRPVLVGGLWLVFALPLPWWIAHVVGWVPLPEQTWVRPVELLYTLLGAALLVLAAVRLHRTGPDAGPAPRPARPPAPDRVTVEGRP
ncbi:glycosyltransferase 87 family protein [Polymorphospora sp. NPDC051019]|uniref:glycosyltransferase 87 family protein n=1 Tax=Polymorphospora sp. NPDC051019 TaxID=3155725 RepID=UPI0034329945